MKLQTPKHADGQNALPLPNELGGDLLWGVPGEHGIAKAIRRSTRQTFYLLETGKLPAKKLGGQWITSRSKLRGFFDSLLADEEG